MAPTENGSNPPGLQHDIATWLSDVPAGDADPTVPTSEPLPQQHEVSSLGGLLQNISRNRTQAGKTRERVTSPIRPGQENCQLNEKSESHSLKWLM